MRSHVGLLAPARPSLIWGFGEGRGMRNDIGFGAVGRTFHIRSVAREPEMDTSQDYC